MFYSIIKVRYIRILDWSEGIIRISVQFSQYEIIYPPVGSIHKRQNGDVIVETQYSRLKIIATT